MNSKETKDENFAYRDIVSLFKFCTNNFSYQLVASTADVMCDIAVNNAVDIDRIALFPEHDIKMLLPNSLDYANEISLEKRMFADEADAPVNRKDAFGEVVVKYKNEIAVGRAKLVSDVSVDKSNVLYFFSRIEKIVKGKWFIAFAVTAVVVFGVYFGLSVYYKYFRKNKYTGNRPKYK
jgi:D-alanyl-D-alanine carboxypeptidase